MRGKAATSGTLLLSAAIAAAQSGAIRLDDPAIGYLSRPLHDPVAELDRKVQAGEFEMRYDGPQGYLRSLLAGLNVAVESQMVVFSKTSVQALHIDPQNPRVLYFNDSAAVGWVRGGSLEVAALDPQQGMVFYTVDQRQWVLTQRNAAPAAGRPSLFRRRTDCLNCHNSKATRGIPGTLLRSVFPSIDGTPLRQFGTLNTDLSTPFDRLWGGWYVTGQSGAARHRGNAVVTNLAKPEAMVTDQTVNLESLKGKIDTEAYLSPYSDIVALMVFEHQMHLTNLLIEAGWRARVGAGAGNVEELVDSLLFVDERPLSDRIQGNSGFAAEFGARGPRDEQGRSLREFDLQHRLMRYPCSYMIYSEAFDGLPAEVREAVYRRMWSVLSGAAKGAKYSRLAASDREAVVEILRATKKGLPAYFQRSGVE
jgi:hypothetical protein